MSVYRRVWIAAAAIALQAAIAEGLFAGVLKLRDAKRHLMRLVIEESVEARIIITEVGIHIARERTPRAEGSMWLKARDWEVTTEVTMVVLEGFLWKHRSIQQVGIFSELISCN